MEFKIIKKSERSYSSLLDSFYVKSKSVFGYWHYHIDKSDKTDLIIGTVFINLLLIVLLKLSILFWVFSCIIGNLSFSYLYRWVFTEYYSSIDMAKKEVEKIIIEKNKKKSKQIKDTHTSETVMKIEYKNGTLTNTFEK